MHQDTIFYTWKYKLAGKKLIKGQVLSSFEPYSTSVSKNIRGPTMKRPHSPVHTAVLTMYVGPTDLQGQHAMCSWPNEPQNRQEAWPRRSEENPGELSTFEPT